jgi:hypothetical protein
VLWINRIGVPRRLSLHYRGWYRNSGGYHLGGLHVGGAAYGTLWFLGLHRFGGWGLSFLFWIGAVLLADERRGAEPLVTALASTPTVWVLMLTTISSLVPWTMLRRIPSAQPDALIWDTDAYGKPDMVKLAYSAYEDSGAEAVICVSNRKLTWSVVHGLERLGIPTLGPIWDS